MVQFASKREEERLALTGSEKEASQANDRDFLSRFLAALEKDPSIPPWQVRRFNNIHSLLSQQEELSQLWH